MKQSSETAEKSHIWCAPKSHVPGGDTPCWGKRPKPPRGWFYHICTSLCWWIAALTTSRNRDQTNSVKIQITPFHCNHHPLKFVTAEDESIPQLHLPKLKLIARSLAYSCGHHDAFQQEHLSSDVLHWKVEVLSPQQRQWPQTSPHKCHCWLSIVTLNQE